MTIAFINFTRSWGGVKTWTLDFGGALQTLGHRVVVILRSGTPFEGACRAAGFAVHARRPGPKYNPVSIAAIWRIFRHERPDVAVVNISKDVDQGAVAARLCGVPVLRRVGLVEDFRDTGEERLLHRLLVARVLVPSEYLRRSLVDRLPWIVQRPVHVIPNSKDLSRYRRARASAEPPFTFGVTSQLAASKGHADLLRALALLKKNGMAVALRVAGTGPLESELRQAAADAGLEGMVSFEGFLGDVPGFLAGLDGFVLPSRNESFANTALEAMCAGLPIVAYAAGGVPEVVGDAGLLIPPGDVEDLAQALARVASSPSLSARLGKAARQRAEERFDLGVNGRRFETLLVEMTGRCDASD